MKVYNLYFSLKDDVSEDEILLLACEFGQAMQQAKIISTWTLDKIVVQGTFDDMLNYHMAIEFEGDAHLNRGFEQVREKYLREEPHASLMNAVSEFKVTFSERIST